MQTHMRTCLDGCCCRLNEIRVLKVRLADMRRELHVLRTGVANVDVLKREVRAPAKRLIDSLGEKGRGTDAPALPLRSSRHPDAQGLCNHACDRNMQVRSAAKSNTGTCLGLQVASLGRQLLQERTKVKALSEELESPLNVHR